MWTLCPTTGEQFDQCLEVDFPKDKSNDIALLHYVDGETTILKGQLMTESIVHVSVTVEKAILTVTFFKIRIVSIRMNHCIFTRKMTIL